MGGRLLGPRNSKATSEEMRPEKSQGPSHHSLQAPEKAWVLPEGDGKQLGAPSRGATWSELGVKGPHSPCAEKRRWGGRGGSTETGQEVAVSVQVRMLPRGLWEWQQSDGQE